MPPSDSYTLESVGRACRVLRAFRADGEALRLADIVERTGLEKTVAFRLLHTLEDNGLLGKAGDGRYLSNVRFQDRRRFRAGYAAQEHGTPFSDAVTASIQRAAEAEKIELIVLDNRYRAGTALNNARKLIAQRVDLAIEFQTHEKVAPVISSLFQEAGIPLIAVGTPHPGASFYGANNYSAGLTAGRAVGQWVRKNWGGVVEQLLLLEIELKGSLPKLRLAGAEEGLRETAAPFSAASVIHVDTRGGFGRTLDLVRNHLRHSPRRRTVVAGVTDLCVLAAIRAFEDAGRAEQCIAVGMGTIAEARAELMKPNSRLMGSVSFFPEKYGDDIIRLALDILHQRPAPPAVYAQHLLLTRENMRRYYPDGESTPNLDSDIPWKQRLA